MLRTHTCGELRLTAINQQVILCGWIQRLRDKGSVLWIDLRDRYGITQLIFEEGKTDTDLFKAARESGREYVIQVEGTVVERLSKNDKIATGEIEIKVTKLTVLNPAKLPPFTIEDETDGGDDLRMKYRYLDLRRNPVREKLQLRHRMAQQTRAFLDAQNFIEVETPVLIKSTPEGARDFVVPSRMHQGEFYALPQSPQTFKQLLMVVKGKVVQMLALQSGMGKKGPWKKQEFILETQSQYPKKVCLSVWGDKVDQFNVKEGDLLVASVELESREYNGRWYTEARAWKIAKNSGSGSDTPPPSEEPFMADSSASDDLPF